MGETLEVGGEWLFSGTREADDEVDVPIEPLRQDYARWDVPVWASFDLADIAERTGVLPGQEVCGVFFRSHYREGLTEERLWVFRQKDREAHEEAKGSPAFLVYFKGDVDEEGYCLSFCLWTSHTEAAAASQGPLHQEAAALAPEFYDLAKLEVMVFSYGSASPGVQIAAHHEYELLPAA
jgi:hypothetical protein